MRVGIVQRARNTPTTIASETTMGETPIVTSLVGASAAPSQAPAVKPHSTPSPCGVRSGAVEGTLTAAVLKGDSNGRRAKAGRVPRSILRGGSRNGRREG